MKKKLTGLLTPLTAALMAGCGAFVAARAAGFPVAAVSVYLFALLSAFIMTLGIRGTVWGIGAAVTLTSLAAGVTVWGISDLGSAVVSFGSEQAAMHLRGGTALALLAGLLLAALFMLLLRADQGRGLCLLITMSLLILSYAVNDKLPLWAAFPGFVAALTAFAVPGDRGGSVRPIAAAAGAALVFLGLLFVPGERTTWQPLENLANDVRSMTEDYFNFTQERVAFSINEQGYDHAGLINDTVVAMLGGKADPSETAVMKVTSDRDILLRGTVKRAYTGYSWVDDQTKSRYLYYDLIHKNVREQVFGTDRAASNALKQVSGTVTFLTEGTSTLFVPAHLSGFKMDKKNAVYYNSAGELFMTRRVLEGDTYGFTASVPVSDAALIEAARTSTEDSNYASIRDTYTQLPGGIDDRVYAMAIDITANCATDAEKAAAVCNYVAQNYTYTLDGRYPQHNEDFVSWFLLEEKQGYCSYFASAMAVLCRIAGVPVRYVEGYYVRGGEDTVITGKNAHAWVEVYLKGLGWTAFDPTARAVGADTGEPDQNEDPDNDGKNDDGDNEEESGPGDEPEATPTPDIGAQNEPTPSPDPSQGEEDPRNDPTPEPDDGTGDLPEEEEDDTGDDDPFDGFNEPDDGDDGFDPSARNRGGMAWLWLLLAVLVLGGAAFFFVRKRLLSSEPVSAAKASGSSMEAALILYRACLTALACRGYVISAPETPGAFARRVDRELKAPSFVAFSDALAAARYGSGSAGIDAVKTGRNAYRALLQGMTRTEKLRYTLRRIRFGIGDTENIP